MYFRERTPRRALRKDQREAFDKVVALKAYIKSALICTAVAIGVLAISDLYFSLHSKTFSFAQFAIYQAVQISAFPAFLLILLKGIERSGEIRTGFALRVIGATAFVMGGIAIPLFLVSGLALSIAGFVLFAVGATLGG